MSGLLAVSGQGEENAFIAAGVFDAYDDPDDEFIFGLNRILDGVEVLISGRRSS